MHFTVLDVLVMIKEDIDLDWFEVILLILYHGFHHQLNHHWRNIIICLYFVQPRYANKRICDV